MKTQWVPTADLRVGDTLAVWWGNGRDTITALRTYSGPLEDVLGAGSKLAEFALFKTGMILEGHGLYQRIGG